MRQRASPQALLQVSWSMVSMENTITWPASIQGAHTSVMWKFSKSKKRPSWQGMNSTGLPAWP